MTIEAIRGNAAVRVGLHYRAQRREWLGFVPVYQTAYGCFEVGRLRIAAVGSERDVSISPHELFVRILALRPYGIVLFHNHPSGVLRPSLEDCDLTRRVSVACRGLGLTLFGHAIVTPRDDRWIVL